MTLEERFIFPVEVGNIIRVVLVLVSAPTQKPIAHEFADIAR